MDDLPKKVTQLSDDITRAIKQLKIVELEQELLKLQEQSQAPDFWSDNLKAQEITKRISKLESRTQPWRDLDKEVHDLAELMGLGDESLKGDLEKQYATLADSFEELKAQLRLSGPYDDYDAIISLH